MRALLKKYDIFIGPGDIEHVLFKTSPQLNVTLMGWRFCSWRVLSKVAFTALRTPDRNIGVSYGLDPWERGYSGYDFVFDSLSPRKSEPAQNG